MERVKDFKIRANGERVEFDNGVSISFDKDRKPHLYVDNKEKSIENMLPPIILALQLSGARSGSFCVDKFKFSFNFSVEEIEE